MTEEKTEKKSHIAGKFIIVGAIVTIFSFALYTLLARIFNNNDLLWIATLISTFAATFVAYFMHARITWKTRTPDKLAIYKFFIWNFVIALAIAPFFTWLFGFITPLYHFAFDISSFLHLPFDYEFVESTSIFILTTIVTMIINFVFYDNFVFGKNKSKEEEK